MNVGGVLLVEGKDAATKIMKRLLQLLTSQGTIINWQALSVGPNGVCVEVYVGPAMGYHLEFPSCFLTPENAVAMEVLCS